MRKYKAMYYKAFDFKTGHTYLIGQFKAKLDAEAWCKTQGMAVIAQTVVPMTVDEYIEAYQNRPDREQRNDEIEALINTLQYEALTKEERKAKKEREREEQRKGYQHDYYERITKPKRHAKGAISAKEKEETKSGQDPERAERMSEETRQILRDLYFRSAELQPDSLWREDIQMGFTNGCRAAMKLIENVLGEEVERESENGEP